MLSLIPSLFAQLNKEKPKKVEEKVYKALIGDIGGTNIRLELISFKKTDKSPVIIKRSENMRSFGFNSFEDSIRSFLADVSAENWPQVAGIGLAGAVLNN